MTVRMPLSLVLRVPVPPMFAPFVGSVGSGVAMTALAVVSSDSHLQENGLQPPAVCRQFKLSCFPPHRSMPESYKGMASTMSVLVTMENSRLKKET